MFSEWILRSYLQGDVLIQIADNQRRLALELEGVVNDVTVDQITRSVTSQAFFFPFFLFLLPAKETMFFFFQFRNFSLEVLQVMESSVQLDIDYISVSESGRDELCRHNKDAKW